MFAPTRRTLLAVAATLAAGGCAAPSARRRRPRRPCSGSDRGRDLRREPQLRQPVRPVPRRRRRGQRHARADDPARPRRHAAAGTGRCSATTASPTARFPRLPNGPFRIDAPPVERRTDADRAQSDPRLLPQQEQINGGQNNRFAAMSTVGGWTMGYYDGSQFEAVAVGEGVHAGRQLLHGRVRRLLPEPPVADLRLRAASTPTRRTRCARVLDADGKLAEAARFAIGERRRGAGLQQRAAGRSRPMAVSVNTSQPPYQPSGMPPAAGRRRSTLADPAGSKRCTCRCRRRRPDTIGDTLSRQGRVAGPGTAGGWNAALADGRQPPPAKRKVIYTRGDGSPNFQPHHQPFNYYARFAPGTADRAEHLKDGDDFSAATSTPARCPR